MRPSHAAVVVLPFAAALLLAAPLDATEPLRVPEEPRGQVTLASGNVIQLETPEFVAANDGWAIIFSYVTSLDLNDSNAVTSEAVELFESHLKEVANTIKPEIIAAVLQAYKRPHTKDGRQQKQPKFNTVFVRTSANSWSLYRSED